MSKNNLVRAPGGPRHRSRIIRLKPGEGVDIHKRIQIRDTRTNKLVRDLGPATRSAHGHPLYEHPSRMRFPAPGGVPTVTGAQAGDKSKIDGWSTYAAWQSNVGSPVMLMKTSWVVPDPPVDQSTQLIYIFNGLENDWQILQPVLQWGASPIGGGAFWAVANWLAESNDGYAYQSDFLRVSPGDKLTGVMEMTSGENGTFYYVSRFEGMSEIDLAIHTTDVLGYAAQTIEAYGVASQDQMPGGKAVSMQSIRVTTADSAPVVWTPYSNFSNSGLATVVKDGGIAGDVSLAFWKS